jgi:hypothetical protein
LQETVPLDARQLARAPAAVASMAGHLVESVIGYQLKGMPASEVSWFPPRSTEPEVDSVLTLGLKRLPVEVKHRAAVGPADCAATEAFCARPQYGADFGLIVPQDHADTIGDRMVAITAPGLLLGDLSGDMRPTSLRRSGRIGPDEKR